MHWRFGFARRSRIVRVIFRQVEFIPTHRKIGHSSSISGRDPRRDHRFQLARGGRKEGRRGSWHVGPACQKQDARERAEAGRSVGRAGVGRCAAAKRTGRRTGWAGVRFACGVRTGRAGILGRERNRKGPAGKEGLGWAKPFHGLDWVLSLLLFYF